MAKTFNRVKQDEFIAEYFANGGRKNAAAKKVGVDYSTTKRWIENDPTFKARLDEFKDMWEDNLRAAALKRATEKSDTLLIFLLKSLNPAQYDDELRKQKWLAEHNLHQAQQVPTQVVLVRGRMPGEDEDVSNLPAVQEDNSTEDDTIN